MPYPRQPRIGEFGTYAFHDAHFQLPIPKDCKGWVRQSQPKNIEAWSDVVVAFPFQMPQPHYLEHLITISPHLRFLFRFVASNVALVSL